MKFLLLLNLSLLLVSCNYANAPQAETGVISAWIDKPLHESTHLLGPIEVIAHGAAYAEVSQLELSYQFNASPDRFVVGAVAPDMTNIKPGVGADTPGVLARSKWTWIPDSAGTYLLFVRAQKGDGSWSDFAQAQIEVILPELPAGGITEPLPNTGPQILPSPSPTPTETPTSAPACVDQAKFIADLTIPDNTNLAPGAAFTKTWRLQNAGTCTWNENYKIVFVSGEPMANATPISMPAIVGPGMNVDISLNLVAPTNAGMSTSNYQIRNPQGGQFGVGANGGVPFYVKIVVGSPPSPTQASDTQAPSVSVSHSPPGTPLEAGKPFTINASASDNVSVARIEIYVQIGQARGELVKTCTNTTGCSFQNTYGSGITLSYSARAYDAAGNQASAPGQTVTFIVIVQ